MATTAPQTGPADGRRLLGPIGVAPRAPASRHQKDSHGFAWG